MIDENNFAEISEAKSVMIGTAFFGNRQIILSQM